MNFRSTSLITIAAALTSLGAAASGGGGNLLVASPNGIVMEGNPVSGDFQFAGVCSGPVQAMATDDKTLYLADSLGRVWGFDLDTKVFKFSYSVGAAASAIAVDGNDLWVGFADASIKRLNSTTGAVKGTMTAPIAITAMMVRNGAIYVGGQFQGIYRASTATGAFNYFACVCLLGRVHSIFVYDGKIGGSDDFGSVMTFEEATGNIDRMFFNIIPDARGTVVFDDDFFLAGADGKVRRFDPVSETIIGTINANVPNVSAMVMSSAPCAADVDGNGAVNGNDFDLYIGNFEQGSILADFNGDDFVTGDDFDLFMEAFIQGC